MKYWGGKAFYNPMIKSSFERRGRAESLDCDLQKSSLAFLFLNLYETRKSEETGVGLLTFPQVRRGSGKVVSLEDELLLRSSECFRCTSKWLPFPSFCCSTGGLFSNLHHENLVGFQKVKVMKMGGLYDWISTPFTVKMAHIQPPAFSQLLFKCPYQQLALNSFCFQ